MTEPHYRKSTQKEFLRVAQNHSVSFTYPGIFRSGAAEVTVKPDRIAPFAAKLSTVLSFDEYDRLTWSIWTVHLLYGDHRPSP